MKKLEEKFSKRGYPASNTNTQRERTKDVAREDLLTDKAKKPSNRTPFTTTYNKQLPQVQKIIN